MQFPVDRGGIPFLDMDPAERTELIHRLYREGKMPVPGTGTSDLGALEILEPVLDLVSGIFDCTSELLDDIF